MTSSWLDIVSTLCAIVSRKHIEGQVQSSLPVSFSPHVLLPLATLLYSLRKAATPNLLADAVSRNMGVRESPRAFALHVVSMNNVMN